MPEEKLEYEPEKQVRMGDLRDLFSSKKMAHKSLLSWYLWYVRIILEYLVVVIVVTITSMWLFLLLPTLRLLLTFFPRFKHEYLNG